MTSFLMLITSILVSQWFFDSKPEPIRSKHINLLNDLVQQLETQGPEHLKQRAAQGLLPPGTEIIIIRGKDLLFPLEIPWWDWQLVEQLNSTEAELRQHTPQGIVFGRYVKSSDGENYKLLLHVPPHQMLKGFLGPRILVILFVSGLVCYGLARYIAAPIKNVSIAARRLSAGDLTARVNANPNNKGKKKRQDEITQLAEDFDSMADNLEQQIKAQQLLLRDVSHELRSPLARLQIAVELARKYTSNDTEDEYNRIIKEVDELDKLIGQLLELPRLDSGTVQLDDSIDMPSLIQYIINDCQYEATDQRKNILFRCDFNTVLVQGNGNSLRSAIENIIRNAIRYTPVENSIDIDLTKVDKEISLMIRDYGDGVPDSELDKIFQPFYRVSHARERRSGGTGIGLAIAQRAINLHRGSIKATNTSPGLQITIHLPILDIE